MKRKLLFTLPYTETIFPIRPIHFFCRITRSLGGKVQVKSLMDAIRYFGRMKDIDETRIGLFGHSYGGFLTLRALSMDEVFEIVGRFEEINLFTVKLWDENIWVQLTPSLEV